MADGTAPVRTIRSASDEAAAMAESSKARTIQSASDEGTTKVDRHVARHPHDQTARSSTGAAAQASRDFVKRAMDGPARQFGAAGGASSRTVQGMTRQADQSLNAAMEFGTVMASNYGAACSEFVDHMHRAAERQREMLNDMLRAHSPSDVLLAGNRYLLGGLQAFFDANAWIAKAAAENGRRGGPQAEPTRRLMQPASARPYGRQGPSDVSAGGTP